MAFYFLALQVCNVPSVKFCWLKQSQARPDPGREDTDLSLIGYSQGHFRRAFGIGDVTVAMFRKSSLCKLGFVLNHRYFLQIDIR